MGGTVVGGIIVVVGETVVVGPTVVEVVLVGSNSVKTELLLLMILHSLDTET